MSSWRGLEDREGIKVKLIQKFMTENDCYKQGKKITPNGMINAHKQKISNNQ